MTRVLTMVLLLMTTDFAGAEDTVPIQRCAVPAAALPGAASIVVTVTSADARQEREISHEKNRYGMRGANILAANDVVAEVRGGIRDILTGKGFGEGRDATVRVEVSRLYSSFDMGFFSATASDKVMASVQVLGTDGRSLYARVYSGTFPLTGVQIMSGEIAAENLRGAHDAMLREVDDDAQLNQALLQARPVAPPSPEAGEPVMRRRERVGT